MASQLTLHTDSGSFKAEVPTHVELEIDKFLNDNLLYQPMTAPLVSEAQKAIDNIMHMYATLNVLGKHGDKIRYRLYPDYSQGMIQAKLEWKF